MKANNITISLPNYGCDKNCPYCISRITGDVEKRGEFYTNLKKVMTIARASQATCLLFTSKGEPLVFVTEQPSRFIDIIKILTEDNTFALPVELQTNGKILNDFCNGKYDVTEKYFAIDKLIDFVDVFAISMDNINQFKEYYKLFRFLKERNKVIRITFNIINEAFLTSSEQDDEMNEIFDTTESIASAFSGEPTSFKKTKINRKWNFEDFIMVCKANGVDQLSFRRISIPTASDKNNVVVKFIEKYFDQRVYSDLIKQFNECEKNLIRVAPFGAKIYDVQGISFTYFDYCLQDQNNTDDIRSLIYMENGHLYTSWSSLASIIF